MLKIVRSFLAVFSLTVISSCNVNDGNHDMQFKTRIVSFDLAGSLRSTFLYNNNIVCLFTNGKVMVYDTNYRHITFIEKKWNQDTSISEIVKWKNIFLLELENRQFVVLDSDLNHKMDLELSLKKINPSFFNVTKDTVWFMNQTGIYFLAKDGIIKYNIKKFVLDPIKKLGEPIYTDSDYNVYVCGVGEFGGNIFFENKHTQKAYSFPGYFSQLLKYRNHYHLIESFDGSSSYMTVSDPTLLFPYQLKQDSVFCCNCDTGYKEWYHIPDESKWRMKRGIKEYYNNKRSRVRLQTLHSFVVNDKLYSICLSDSALIILEHTDSVRTIMSTKRIASNGFYHTVHCSESNGRILIGLNGTYWKLDPSNRFDIQENESGIIVIQGSKIDFCETHSEEKVKAERI